MMSKPSIHTDRAIAVARSKGAAAGNPANADLFQMSKRELVEIALHLAALCFESYDDALANGSARLRIIEERGALHDNGLI